MVGSTFYIAENSNAIPEVISVRVVAHWNDFFMVEGTLGTGEAYLGVMKADRLFRSEIGARTAAA